MKVGVLAAWAVGAGLLAWGMEGGAPLGTYKEAERRHWALQPRAQVEPPQFVAQQDRAWVKNPIDAFILARLKKEGLRPSPPADRETLIRRAYFVVTGLPPTPEEIDAFVRDRSPGAYERMIERLLASPHYGERWAQHWLDVVRFAESDGFEYDTHRKDAWRYRDYVIRAFNEDKPYDRFIVEQLAGDELAPQDEEMLVAAGFNRLGPVRKNAGNQEVASSRNEVLTEMTNAVGAVFLGMTVGCARCHDHKFDPIRQSDYYRLQAFFAGVFELDKPKATPEEVQAWKAKVEPIERQMKELRQAMAKLRDQPELADRLEQMRKKIEELEKQMPEPLPAVHTVVDKPQERTPIHVLARGDYAARGPRVGMRPLGVFLPEGAPELPETVEKPRLELARWIADPNHPLTARVMVNRLWHYNFGRGLVATPNDFGRMGERPSHPELLDWLANEFVRSGWSIKHMQRLMLTSNTFRQSSALPVDWEFRKQALEKDANNRLLWRYNRRRLEAEAIRDAMLAAAGTLNLKMGGPSVLVPIHQELVNALYKPSQWVVTPDVKEHTRRSIYLMHKRNLRLPFLEVFDAPDLQVSCARRESSTHAPQALELLNGDLANQQAEALARRLEREAGGDVAKQVTLAFRLTTGKRPNAQQLKASLEFLREHSKKEFALAVFNLNSFLYLN